MKIEKVNDQQIRCTLTKDDLSKRQLKISELAYGTDKAKNLFKDMMEQASFEFGFEAENIPLMIEAIPMSPECLVLIITKVENPEELDTRFSQFISEIEGSYEDLEQNSENGLSDEELYDLFRRIQEKHASQTKSKAFSKTLNMSGITDEEEQKLTVVSIMYTFSSLTTITKLAHMTKYLYDGINSLYKDTKNKNYILVITNGRSSISSFNKICNMLSEYGELMHTPSMSDAFLREHHTPIIMDNALQTLSQM